MKIRNNRGAVAETETITVTISSKFLKNVRQIAYLFRDEDKDLGLILEDHAAWVFENLCADPTTDGPFGTDELEAAIDDARWSTREECELAAQRLSQKLGPRMKVEICGRGDSWRIYTFRYPRCYAVWKYCRSEGIDYEEELARIAKLDWEERKRRVILLASLQKLLENGDDDDEGEEWKE
jgi:hypothetical protein